MADFARAAKLRELRTERHLSQEYVAAELGVTSKTYRTWESGGKIRWENAKKLEAFYGVDPEELVTRELPDDAPAAGEVQTQLDRIEAKLDDIISMLAQVPEQAPARTASRPKRRTARTATG